MSSVKSANGFPTKKTKIHVFNIRFLAYCFLFIGFIAIGKSSKENYYSFITFIS